MNLLFSLGLAGLLSIMTAQSNSTFLIMLVNKAGTFMTAYKCRIPVLSQTSTNPK